MSINTENFKKETVLIIEGLRKELKVSSEFNSPENKLIELQKTIPTLLIKAEIIDTNDAPELAVFKLNTTATLINMNWTDTIKKTMTARLTDGALKKVDSTRTEYDDLVKHFSIAAVEVKIREKLKNIAVTTDNISSLIKESKELGCDEKTLEKYDEEIFNAYDGASDIAREHIPNKPL